MAKFIVLDADDRVLRTVDCHPDDAQHQARAGEAIIPVADAALPEGKFPSAERMFKPTTTGAGFVDRPVLHADAATIAADGVDKVSFKVPAGTRCWFADQEHVIEDGAFLFRTVQPGTFRFLLLPPWPYQRLRLTVTADGF